MGLWRRCCLPRAFPACSPALPPVLGATIRAAGGLLNRAHRQFLHPMRRELRGLGIRRAPASDYDTSVQHTRTLDAPLGPALWQRGPNRRGGFPAHIDTL